MKDWSWDRIGTLAVSVATLLILLFGGIRGVATQADVAAAGERLDQKLGAVEERLDQSVAAVRERLDQSLAAVEARLAAAIEATRIELKAEMQEIRQYHISHLGEPRRRRPRRAAPRLKIRAIRGRPLLGPPPGAQAWAPPRQAARRASGVTSAMVGTTTWAVPSRSAG